MSDPKELSEDDLFDGAVSDGAAEASVVTEQPAEQVEQVADQVAEGSGEPDAAGLTAERPPIPPKPEWRMREDAERARAAEADLANERAEKAALRQRLEALERAGKPEAKQVEKPAKPDPLLDPNGYAKAVHDEIRQELLAERREESLQRARETNQKDFDEAFLAAQKAFDPALAAKMQASRDPGKALLEWHRENKTRQEIGGDLTAYNQRIREAALKDPEFRKTAIAAWQADAQPQSNGRPRVELPPSLNGASRSNAALRASQADVSDDALWDEATTTTA